MTAFSLRPYQQEALAAIAESHKNANSSLVEMATGLGKTVIFSRYASSWEHGRTMVICPMIPLIGQAAKKLHKETGICPAIEQASEWSNEAEWARSPYIVASKQSLCSGKSSKRYERFQDVGLVICDEAHFCATEQYAEMIRWFMDRGAKVLGLTATAKRHDKRAMGQVFDDCCYQYGVLDAINDGWLVAPRVVCKQLASLDLSGVETTTTFMGRDFNQKQLNDKLEDVKVIYEIAEAVNQETRGEKTVVFCASIAEAQAVSELLVDSYKIKSGWVCADTTKCTEQRRHETLQSFTSDDPDSITHVCNVGILCLDAQTEVLTKTGWVGIDSASDEHEYANWSPDGVYYSTGSVVRRARMEGEKMVVACGKRINIRVSEDHTIISRTGESWKKRKARDCVGKRFDLPVCGVADPLDFCWEYNTPNISRLVVKTAYNLRTYNAYDWGESKAEAERRVRLRVERAVPRRPCELSLAECAFLGFWAGDGTSACGRVSVTQGKVYPWIIAWIHKTLRDASLETTVSEYPTHYTWTLRSGLGGGDQERDGGYAHLKRYFQKVDFTWLRGLNEQQFDSFIYGLWMADGNHGDGTTYEGRGRISGINAHLLEMLQDVGSCRGYKTQLRWRPNGPKATTLLGLLSFNKQSFYAIGDDRFQFEEGWAPERLWCVTVDSGALITRRKGIVTVLGNTTGWDYPALKNIVMARPTKSEPLYTQIIGRGTRALEGVVDFEGSTAETRKQRIAESAKPYFRIIDLVDNSLKHRLVTAVDVLGGKWTLAEREAVLESLVKKGGGAVDLTEEKLAVLREKERAEEERQRRQLASRQAAASFHDVHVDVFGQPQGGMVRDRQQRDMMTEGQKRYLWVLGFKDIDNYEVTKAQAGRMITQLKDRGMQMRDVRRTNKLRHKSDQGFTKPRPPVAQHRPPPPAMKPPTNVMDEQQMFDLFRRDFDD